MNFFGVNLFAIVIERFVENKCKKNYSPPNYFHPVTSNVYAASFFSISDFSLIFPLFCICFKLIFEMNTTKSLSQNEFGPISIVVKVWLIKNTLLKMNIRALFAFTCRSLYAIYTTISIVTLWSQLSNAKCGYRAHVIRNIERIHANISYGNVISWSKFDHISCMTLFFLSLRIKFDYHE